MNRLTARQYKFLTSLVAMMTIMGVDAQTAPEVPRLVVNIIIDQLRTDYLEAFSPLYGEKGFSRLMREGRVYSQAQYPFSSPDRASAIACLMSGTVPYENGIVAERWLDRGTLLPVYCVDDKAFAGNATTECSSAANLGVSTFTDELKVSTEGKGLVYSIAPSRDAAVLMAGHAADGAFWINDETGHWCGSSYYGKLPQWISFHEDNSQALYRNIGSITWEPINSLVGSYNYFVSGGMKTPFKHKFKGERNFRQFKASALVNEEVTSLATRCVQNAMLGIDRVTDVLNVCYYAGNFDHKTVAECPIELQDTYVRLDRQLAELVDLVESRVGRDHVLFVVTSTGYSDTEQGTTDLSRYRIPTGEFNITRAYRLLNMYLIAVYGQGDWIESVMGNQIYLNLKLIENKGLNLTEVLERCGDFLIQLSGVRDVFTSQRLSQGAWTPGISNVRNAYNPKNSGDILIQVSPGWQLVNEETHEKSLQRDSYMGFPLYFYGADIQSEVVLDPVTLDHVAPTVAQCLRIRAPNGCDAAPLLGIRKQ